MFCFVFRSHYTAVNDVQKNGKRIEIKMKITERESREKGRMGPYNTFVFTKSITNINITSLNKLLCRALLYVKSS